MAEHGYADSKWVNSMTQGRSIKQALQWAQMQLQGLSNTQQLDSELLLAFALERDRTYLWTWPDKTVSNKDLLKFESLLVDRKKGTPVAYLLGQKEFWGLPLKVTPDTLIPRPETELLVELLLTKTSENRPYRIADLGTGSGAIAIALAHELRESTIVATDKCWAALKVAEHNAKNLNLTKVEFRQGSWCEPLEKYSYDFIVSNPPYIDKCDPHLKTGDVRFEPRTALVSDGNGLGDIEKIIRQAPHHLKAGALIAFEHGCSQGSSVRELLGQGGFSRVETVQDMADLDRVTFGFLM